jgi:hypothetical protein
MYGKARGFSAGETLFIAEISEIPKKWEKS